MCPYMCFFQHFALMLLLVSVEERMEGSTSPWKNACMSTLDENGLRDTLCTRWEENSIPRYINV